jgi:hypothetical protein
LFSNRIPAANKHAVVAVIPGITVIPAKAGIQLIAVVLV